jgi:hypothetical protein
LLQSANRSYCSIDSRPCHTQRPSAPLRLVQPRSNSHGFAASAAAPAKNVANEVITPLGGLSFNNGNFGGTAVRDKQRAASIDNTRSINVHLPGLVAGSYDTNGALIS